MCNCLEVLVFVFLRFAFIWENKRKQKARAGMTVTDQELNDTAFQDLTDKQNIHFTYVY